MGAPRFVLGVTFFMVITGICHAQGNAQHFDIDSKAVGVRYSIEVVVPQTLRIMMGRVLRLVGDLCSGRRCTLYRPTRPGPFAWHRDGGAQRSHNPRSCLPNEKCKLGHSALLVCRPSVAFLHSRGHTHPSP